MLCWCRALELKHVQSLAKYVTSLKFHLLKCCSQANSIYRRFVAISTGRSERHAPGVAVAAGARRCCCVFVSRVPVGRYRPQRNPIKCPTRSWWRLENWRVETPPTEVSISVATLAWLGCHAWLYAHTHTHLDTDGPPFQDKTAD